MFVPESVMPEPASVKAATEMVPAIVRDPVPDKERVLAVPVSVMVFEEGRVREVGVEKIRKPEEVGLELRLICVFVQFPS